MITIIIMFSCFVVTAVSKASIQCNFSDSKQTQQCYGAEGQELFFHLSVAKMKKSTELRLTKDEIYRILKIDKNGTVAVNKDFLNHSEQIHHGTFTLGNAMKKHSGEYVLEEYGADGKIMRTVQVNLKIQAPALLPGISNTSLTPQNKSVNSSAMEGDMEFTLSFDKDLLIQTKIESWKSLSVSNVIITLHGQLGKKLVCDVRNKVSTKRTVIQLTRCKGTYGWIVAVTRLIYVLLLLLALILGHVALTKKRSRATLGEGNNDLVNSVI